MTSSARLWVDVERSLCLVLRELVVWYWVSGILDPFIAHSCLIISRVELHKLEHHRLHRLSFSAREKKRCLVSSKIFHRNQWWSNTFPNYYFRFLKQNPCFLKGRRWGAMYPFFVFHSASTDTSTSTKQSIYPSVPQQERRFGYDLSVVRNVSKKCDLVQYLLLQWRDRNVPSQVKYCNYNQDYRKNANKRHKNPLLWKG